MGNQPDGLQNMEKFDGNETKIIWPAWKLDLDRRITFEFGEVGVDIVDGRIRACKINESTLPEKSIDRSDNLRHQTFLNLTLATGSVAQCTLQSLRF